MNIVCHLAFGIDSIRRMTRELNLISRSVSFILSCAYLAESILIFVGEAGKPNTHTDNTRLHRVRGWIAPNCTHSPSQSYNVIECRLYNNKRNDWIVYLRQLSSTETSESHAQLHARHTWAYQFFVQLFAKVWCQFHCADEYKKYAQQHG